MPIDRMRRGGDHPQLIVSTMKDAFQVTLPPTLPTGEKKGTPSCSLVLQPHGAATRRHKRVRADMQAIAGGAAQRQFAWKCVVTLTHVPFFCQC